MGKIPIDRFGEVDPLHPTVMAYAKKLNLNEMHFRNIIDDSLTPALNDFDKDGEYRKGVGRNGQPMKRATTCEELMNVFTYETAPSTYVAITTGARKSITNNEAKTLELWEANAEQTEKIRYVDSSREMEKYLREEKNKLQSKVWELEEKLNPQTPEELEEEGWEHNPYIDDIDDEEEEELEEEIEEEEEY